MLGKNEMLSALVAVNPIWADVVHPFELGAGTSCHIGTSAPLVSFFLTGGIVCTSYERTVIGLSGPGDAVGYHALLNEDPSPLMTSTETPIKGFKVMTKSCRRITDGCKRSRRILERYGHLLMIEGAINRAAAASKVGPHLAFRVLTLMDAQGQPELCFKHSQFARFLGMSRRVSITEVLETWSAEGLSEQVDRGMIRILKPDVLETLAGPAIKDLRERRAAFLGFLQAIRQYEAA